MRKTRPDRPSPALRGRGDRSRKRTVGEGDAAEPKTLTHLLAAPSGTLSQRERGETRCGYVALIGAPNAGKSTLLNRLVGRKLAIVTPKVQTTRARLLGIAIESEAQLIYVDTPGIFAPRRRLDRAMVAAAWAGAADADRVVLLVDAARPDDPDTRRIVEQLKASGR